MNYIQSQYRSVTHSQRSRCSQHIHNSGQFWRSRGSSLFLWSTSYATFQDPSEVVKYEFKVTSHDFVAFQASHTYVVIHVNSLTQNTPPTPRCVRDRFLLCDIHCAERAESVYSMSSIWSGSGPGSHGFGDTVYI